MASLRSGGFVLLCFMGILRLSLGFVQTITFSGVVHGQKLLACVCSTRTVARWQRHSGFAAATDASDPSSSSFADRVYFDIEVGGTPLGRLTFRLADPPALPLQTENLKKLCAGDRRSIDPAAHYVGCTFDFGPDYVEDGSGRYRWSHVLRGRGRNAVGRADEPLSDPEGLLASTHSIVGGQYYGHRYEETESDPGVLLTIPVMGPGRGSSRLAIVRVGESPREWRERLLLNSAVVGWLEDGLDTLHSMARQRLGPPTVSDSGVL